MTLAEVCGWAVGLGYLTGFFVVTGLTLFALGSQAPMGQSWRVGTTGPFTWSRYPVFLGQIVLFWVSVPFAGWPMLIAAVLVTGSAIAQVRLEESVMQDIDGWRRYAQRVPRWLGPV